MLRNATYIAIAAFLVGSSYLHWHMGMDHELFISVVLGCVAGIIVGLITEYYTGGTPVRKMAEISRSGAATNIIYGLSIGMESTVAPVIILIIRCIICSLSMAAAYLVFLLQRLQCLQPLVLP